MALPELSAIPKLILNLNISTVGIFRDTRAIDIPDKINSIVNSFKQYINNEITMPVTEYINTHMSDISDYITASVTSIDAENTTFRNDMATNIGTYLDSGGAGYNVVQSRSLIEVGETSDVLRDDDGNITKITQGAVTIDHITYDDYGTVSSFTEVITVDSVASVKKYIITTVDDMLVINYAP